MMPHYVYFNNNKKQICKGVRHKGYVWLGHLLCFIVPDAHRAVQRARGYNGFSHADGQISDGLVVEGL